METRKNNIIRGKKYWFLNMFFKTCMKHESFYLFVISSDRVKQ